MKKKKNNWFLTFLKLSLVCFFIVYIILENGYYENKLSKEVTLTNDNIRQFEEDIKNNKIVDISNYKVETNTNYSNRVSKFGQKLTDSTGKIIVKGVSDVFDVLKSLLW